MEPLALFLLLVVLALIGWFVARPLTKSRSRRADAGQVVSALMAERERLLTALRELDEDHALGKVPEEDYPAQRAQLLQQGADILRRLDEARSAQEAARGKGRPAAKPASVSDEDLEVLIARRRSARKEKAGGFCPHCGKPILMTDRFCPSCGTVLK